MGYGRMAKPSMNFSRCYSGIGKQLIDAVRNGGTSMTSISKKLPTQITDLQEKSSQAVGLEKTKIDNKIRFLKEILTTISTRTDTLQCMVAVLVRFKHENAYGDWIEQMFSGMPDHYLGDALTYTAEGEKRFDKAVKLFSEQVSIYAVYGVMGDTNDLLFR